MAVHGNTSRLAPTYISYTGREELAVGLRVRLVNQTSVPLLKDTGHTVGHNVTSAKIKCHVGVLLHN